MKKDKYTIEVKVDTNDADYASEVSSISEKELEELMPLIEAIKKFKPYESLGGPPYGGKWTHDNNFPHGECCRRDMGEKTPEEIYSEIDEGTMELFTGLCPSTEYGFHTIKRIRICEMTPWKTLL